MTISNRISELRKKQGLSQYQLAKLLSVSRQAVSKWENGIAIPDMNNLIQLSEVLKTDIEYLTSGKVPSPSPSVLTLKDKEVTKVVEVEKIVEKVVQVDRPVYVEVERLVEVDKPVIKKVFRTKYLRNPVEYAFVAIIAFLFGLLLGLIFQ